MFPGAPPARAPAWSEVLTPTRTQEAEPELDGRRLRSRRNRERIVNAMMELVRAGDLTPSAESVAEKAGVGLRSVFRHFEDMESLYREMGVAIREEVHPLISISEDTENWRGNLEQLIGQKTRAFEQVMMFFIAGRTLLHKSPTVRADHDKGVEMERKALRRLLPAVICRDRDLFDAIELACSFDTWVRLRQDQGLSVRRSRDVVLRLVGALLDGPGN